MRGFGPILVGVGNAGLPRIFGCLRSESARTGKEGKGGENYGDFHAEISNEAAPSD
jgi:hypothetical protein